MGTGTGKTITSLFRFRQNPTDKLLVVCPRSVVEQWAAVIDEHFGDLRVQEYKRSWNSKRKNQHLMDKKGSYDVVIINFEIVWKMTNLNKLVDDGWTIIIDESHRIKSLGTKRSPVRQTHAVLSLGQLTDWKILLTATPAQGNFGGYLDYFSQLKFLGYMDMDIKEFMDRYVVIERKQIRGRPYPIPVIIGYKRTEEIEKLLRQTCRYFTTTYEDFEPQHTKVALARAKTYARTKREMVYKDILLDNSARKRIGLKTLTSGRIAGYGEFKSDGKLTYDDNTIKLDWLSDFLKDTDEVVSIFYRYNVERDQLIELLEKLGKKYVIISGQTKNKYETINKKEYDVVIGQYKAMSESLDGLQYKCHISILYAMPESSLTYKQSIGRIDRDGQTQQPMYYYLVMSNTVDEDIYNMIEQKIEFTEATLENLIIKEV